MDANMDGVPPKAAWYRHIAAHLQWCNCIILCVMYVGREPHVKSSDGICSEGPEETKMLL
jgi:hypothetical protein